MPRETALGDRGLLPAAPDGACETDSEQSSASPCTPARLAGAAEHGVEPLDILLLIKRPSDPELGHLQVLKDVQVSHNEYDISSTTPSTVRKGTTPSDEASTAPEPTAKQENEAAVAIQAAYRGHAARREQALLKVEAEQAAVKIQAAYRGHSSRRVLQRDGMMPVPKAEKEMRAACTLQRAFRTHSSRKVLEAKRQDRRELEERDDEESAAAVLQAAFRFLTLRNRARQARAAEAAKMAAPDAAPKRSSLALLSDAHPTGAAHLRLVAAAGDAKTPQPPSVPSPERQSPATRRLSDEPLASLPNPTAWLESLGHLQDAAVEYRELSKRPFLRSVFEMCFGPVPEEAPAPEEEKEEEEMKHRGSLALLSHSLPEGDGLRMLTTALDEDASTASSLQDARALLPPPPPKPVTMPPPVSEPEASYLSYMKTKRVSKRVLLMAPGNPKAPPPAAAFNHGSFHPKAAVPIGQRPTCLLLHNLGADKDGWDLEQVAPLVVLNGEGADLTSAAIEDPVFDRIHNHRAGAAPAAADVFAADGAFHITKDELLQQRDSCVVYTFYKGPSLTALFASLGDSRYQAWAHAYRNTQMRHIGLPQTGQKIARDLRDEGAKVRGRVDGLREKCAVLAKKATGGTEAALETARADLDKAEREQELLELAEQSVKRVPVPDSVLDVMGGEDEFMKKLTLAEIAEGTCLAMDAMFMVDELGTMRRSAPIYTIFAPAFPSTTPSASALQGAYRLALSALEARACSDVSLSPLLPQNTAMPLASPPHVVMMHLTVLAEVLGERSYGLAKVYVSTMGIPPEVARRAFEKHDLGTTDVVLHCLTAKNLALALRAPTALVVPTAPLAILRGVPGGSWAAARGHVYRQEEEAVAESTAVLALSDFNTVYNESLRHRLVDQKIDHAQASPLRKGRVVGSRLPAAARGAGRGARREARVLQKMREAQERDTQLQEQLEAAAQPTAEQRRLKDKVLEEQQQRQAFIERMELKVANAPKAAAVEKAMYQERDLRIQERQARKEKELQELRDEQRARDEEAEHYRRERNRIHREQEEARRKRQQERAQRMELEKEGQRVLEMAKKVEEEKKRARAAKELLAAQQKREERRQKLKAELAEKRRQEEIAKLKAQQAEQKQKQQQQEEIRRKMMERAEAERRKREEQGLPARHSPHVAGEEDRKFAELQQLKQKNAPPQRKNLPPVLPKLDRDAAMRNHAAAGAAAAHSPGALARGRSKSKGKLAPLGGDRGRSAPAPAKAKTPRQRAQSSEGAALLAPPEARAVPPPPPPAAVRSSPPRHYTLQNIEELAKPLPGAQPQLLL